MKIRTLALTLALATLLVTAGCGNGTLKKARQDGTGTTDVILADQVGYYPDARKVALIRSDAVKFDIIDASSGKVVYNGATGEPRYWEYSGDTVRAADFSGLTKPGTYRLCTGGSSVCSGEFRIGDDIYTDITKAAIKAFYFNRSGFEIAPEYGSRWARPAGHPDTVVIVHESAASGGRPAGTVISSPGGWYDAGDYNKYIVNSSITNYTLLLFYQLFPEYCRSLSLNIPESDNDIPDLVDELLYNLKWMLTMQDPEDGGVYHKLTNKGFGGFEMPDEATESRYVVQKTTAAALDFAAVMTMAGRLFADDPSEELRNLSVTCLDASDRAMTWAASHPDVFYLQSKDISTGEYGDNNLADELFWATAEVDITRGTPPTDDFIEGFRTSTPSWNQVDMLGLISLAFTDDPAFSAVKKAAAFLLVGYADMLVDKAASSPYRISLDHFNWGSNSDVANQALLMIIAMKITGDSKYLPFIQDEVDYLLGRNATGYCFVTGFGTLSPMNIHHRPSGSDGVTEPVPGFLVGGPNTNVMDDCPPPVKRSSFPAKSYADQLCSYSTNEICINWNAPLVFVLGAMDDLGGTE